MPKATIEYYWSPKRSVGMKDGKLLKEHEVNVRIKASNGLIVAQITQGFKDKRDARRGVNALCHALGMYDGAEGGWLGTLLGSKLAQEKGPGANPNKKRNEE